MREMDNAEQREERSLHAGSVFSLERSGSIFSTESLATGSPLFTLRSNGHELRNRSRWFERFSAASHCVIFSQ